jgi:hypothetical protein
MNMQGSKIAFSNTGNASTSPDMLITGGKVGIGTTTPDQMLTVNGTIHSTEVLVDLSVPAPDYVFEKKYKLRPLSEVRRYINMNNHLPEIPSAEVMEKDGVNLSDMNMKLLKKVEELTLYLISENEKNKSQQREINDLKRHQDHVTKTIIKK